MKECLFMCVRFGESFLATWPGSEEIPISLKPDPDCLCVVHNIPSCQKGEGFVLTHVHYECVNERH